VLIKSKPAETKIPLSDSPSVIKIIFLLVDFAAGVGIAAE